MKQPHHLLRTLCLLVPLLAALLPAPLPAQSATPILTANFDAGTDGFVYFDDAFGTAQPGYADGTHLTTGGYSGGALRVTLGGVNATAITDMSGGWSFDLDLPATQPGVLLTFRYKLEQSATYEFDEFSRVRARVDATEYGRGAKSYVDHIGGDGSSSQGNSSSFLPTTDWQMAEIFVGPLNAGVHTLTLGGFNNKKDASDETTTLLIDDVTVTGDNPAPTTTAAQTLADRVDIDQFLADIQGVAQFHDRCRGSGMSCSSTDYTTNYMNALAWVEGELQALGYTTTRHNFNYSGNTGTNLWATKIGATTPTQMYMVSGHLDARSGGDGFDDDGSGVALVLGVARVLAGADVTTDKSVRFIFWDKEELGLYGAYGYVQDRRSLQGTLAEPTWLGIIQHDMILYDHGAGTRTTAQSAYADLDVEWRAGTTKAADSMALALKWRYVNGVYAPDYPATAYNHSTNTDDTPFHPYVASVSVRENRRSLTSGGNAEWINPYYHTTSDIESSYTHDDDGDGKRDDIELGYNAVRTTLGLVAELAGAQIASPNTPPVADAQAVSTACNTPVEITLTGSDADSDPLSFAAVSAPEHGSLSGFEPVLTYTPAPDYSGADSFSFVANDGTEASAPASVTITVGACAALPLPFNDDFESSLGWQADRDGTDSATAGAWERDDPEPTADAGPKQPGDTPSGTHALVTGAAGGEAGSNDVDGGVTTILSPAIQLPTGQDITLSLQYSFAHGRNSSDADFLQVQVVGATTATVLDVRGSRTDVDAAWTSLIAPLNDFAGQMIRVRLVAADLGGKSLVEAAVDDVAIEATPATTPLLAATFDAGADGFTYADDAFRNTSEPAYADGLVQASGGFSGGALQVTHGGGDNEIVAGMSGGWTRTFTLSTAGEVVVTFWYKLTQTPDYESSEISQALVAVDGVLYGAGANDFVAQVTGNGNGGSVETTGWRLFSRTLGPLAAGPHTLTLGGWGSGKSQANEVTEILFDAARVMAK